MAKDGGITGLGLRISQMCAAIGSQAEAARRVGVLPRQMQRYIRGEQTPGFDVMAALANAANADLNWAATGEGTPAAPSRRPLDLETMRRVNALNERLAKLYATHEQVEALAAQHRAAEEYAASVGIPLDDMDDEQLDRAYGLLEAADKARRVLQQAAETSPGSDTPAVATTIRRKRPA